MLMLDMRPATATMYRELSVSSASSSVTAMSHILREGVAELAGEHE